MDPDKTLADGLDLARTVKDHGSNSDAEDLADALLDLDEWIAKGGYLPRRWRAAAPAPARGASLAERWTEEGEQS